MTQFLEISRGLNVPLLQYVPGEHDAGLDDGALYRDLWARSTTRSTNRGVHFIPLDHVSCAKPEVGPEPPEGLKN